MTEMDIESTACGRNEIGPQDRYFLPDPGFTPGHDRDAYRVTQVRAPIFLSRNEDFQLFSTFFRFFHPSPKTEVERGGKRWNANAKRVETGETDSTLFHLFPPVSTCFHLKIISGRTAAGLARSEKYGPCKSTTCALQRSRAQSKWQRVSCEWWMEIPLLFTRTCERRARPSSAGTWILFGDNRANPS